MTDPSTPNKSPVKQAPTGLSQMPDLVQIKEETTDSSQLTSSFSYLRDSNLAISYIPTSPTSLMAARLSKQEEDENDSDMNPKEGSSQSAFQLPAMSNTLRSSMVPLLPPPLPKGTALASGSSGQKNQDAYLDYTTPPLTGPNTRRKQIKPLEQHSETPSKREVLAEMNEELYVPLSPQPSTPILPGHSDWKPETLYTSPKEESIQSSPTDSVIAAKQRNAAQTSHDATTIPQQPVTPGHEDLGSSPAISAKNIPSPSSPQHKPIHDYLPPPNAPLNDDIILKYGMGPEIEDMSSPTMQTKAAQRRRLSHQIPINQPGSSPLSRLDSSPSSSCGTPRSKIRSRTISSEELLRPHLFHSPNSERLQNLEAENVMLKTRVTKLEKRINSIVNILTQVVEQCDSFDKRLDPSTSSPAITGSAGKDKPEIDLDHRSNGTDTDPETDIENKDPGISPAVSPFKSAATTTTPPQLSRRQRKPLGSRDPLDQLPLDEFYSPSMMLENNTNITLEPSAKEISLPQLSPSVKHSLRDLTFERSVSESMRFQKKLRLQEGDSDHEDEDEEENAEYSCDAENNENHAQDIHI